MAVTGTSPRLGDMAKILVVYASTHGHTAKIATRIGDVIEADGLEVDVHDARSPGDHTSPAGYDAVIVGGSIHADHYQREVVEWAKRHSEALGAMPSAFFCVCLTAADDTEESDEATRGYLDAFVEETGWAPKEAVTFAGALQYREYDFMTRLVMRMMMKRGGHPTDASRDYDYTDWDAVERFAHECAAMAAPALRRG